MKKMPANHLISIWRCNIQGAAVIREKCIPENPASGKFVTANVANGF
jgi:hypothetical protein